MPVWRFGTKIIPTNSSSPGWGMNGYCWIPYDYLANPHLASDFWAIQKLVAK
jgi:C1A family cysteine protease